ncbi:MAG: hypothetical protein AAGE52_41220 [Myxococcota bacterium]
MRILLVLALACGSSTGTSSNAEPTAGDESSEVGVLHTEVQSDESEDAQAARLAEYEARCAGVSLVDGPPPEPPPTPSIPELRAAEEAYQAALVPAPTPPELALVHYNEWAQSTLADWVQEFSTRSQALQRELNNIDRAQANVPLVWIARSLGFFVENLKAVPAPEEISAEPEMLAVYQDALERQARPVLANAKGALELAEFQDPRWASYAADLREWLTQEECAPRPLAP